MLSHFIDLPLLICHAGVIQVATRSRPWMNNKKKSLSVTVPEQLQVFTLFSRALVLHIRSSATVICKWSSAPHCGLGGETNWTDGCLKDCNLLHLKKNVKMKTWGEFHCLHVLYILKLYYALVEIYLILL